MWGLLHRGFKRLDRYLWATDLQAGSSKPRQVAVALIAVALATGFSAAAGQVVVSEILYDPPGGSTNEFVEVFNAGGDAVDLGGWRFADGITYLFPAPTPLAPGAYLVVAADRAVFAALHPAVTNLAPGAFAGQLNNQGERIALADAATNVVFEVTFDNNPPWPAAAAGLGSSLVLLDPLASPADPANWGASVEPYGSPGGPGGQFAVDIVINEVLAHTDPPQEDAIELVNLTTGAVDVSGWYLSDDGAERKKYRFPTNSIVPPLGYRVVYQGQTTNGPDALIPFAVNAKGDDLFLSQGNAAGDLVRFADEVGFDASKNGVSFGRHPDRTGGLIPLAAPTFGVTDPATVEDFRAGTGAPNAGPWVGPVVINEIMYHPSTSSVPPRMASEYIELLNASTSAVPLYNVEFPELTWSLSGGVSFVFPTNLALGPGQFLLVVATNDLEGFRASYGVSTNVLIVGPWSNSLDNAGDTIRVRVPNSPEPPSNTVGRYVQDVVEYDDGLPWPLAADGLGGALERNDPAAYGNTPDNWHSSPGVATPGETNTVFLPPGSIVISEVMAVNRHALRDEDGDFSDWIELYNTRPYDISLSGWHLTDQSSMPTQWTFPPVSIPARGYLVVFASQKNRTNDPARLHANFALDEAGEYLALFRPDLVREFAFDPAFPPQSADVSYGYEAFGNLTAAAVEQGSPGRCLVPTNAAALDANWMEPAFDDSGWLPATNGLGYDLEPTYAALISTDLRSQMYNKLPSAFVRFPFVVSNSAAVAQMDLRLKFEDGFIAWLNGAPVASNNAPANAAWDSRSVASRSDTLAVVFESFDLAAQIFRLVDGTNVLAFQLLNQATNSSDLLLLPELQLAWMGGSTGTAGHALGFLYPGTPGSQNPGVLPGVAPSPALSHPGGVFAGELAVTLTCARADAVLRFTFDGTEPTAASPVYSAPLSITNDAEVLARAFLPGLVPSPAVGAVYRKAFLGINEFLASNATATPEIADFTDFGDWVELFNAGPSNFNLGGYHLSDNLEQPFRWRIPDGAVIPARGHLLVWADGYDSYPGLSLTRPFWPYRAFTTRSYHSNFKLAAEGESIGLFSPSGSRIDAIAYGPQSVDISCGRYPDGSADWGYFGEPTAGASNRPPALAHNLYRAPAVTIDPTNEALIVTGPVQVALSSGPGVTEIRFTTNGAMPTLSSMLYTQAFTLATSGVVRARAYAPDRHPGPVATRTFLRDARTPELPMLSVVIDPKLLYDPVIGIYTNVLKEREVPGNIQFCTTPGNTGFQVDAGFRIFGLNTFLYAQKPFTVYLDGKYGTPELAYALFPDKPIGFFDRFVLRNGNDDWPQAFFRDTLGQQMLMGVIGNALQSYRPCAIYLNGAYYGLINIQEKMDEMFCAKNYGVDLANVDFFEMDGTASTDDWLLDAGTADGWNSLMAYIGTNNLADPAHYEYVKSQVDTEDLVDYVAGQTFVLDTSWFHNRKWWRDRNPGGRWRWCFVDMDRALTPGAVNNNQFGSMASTMAVFHELLSNAEFRAYCAQRVMAHLNGSFGANRILPVIDREAQRIRSEIEQHALLYGTKGGIPSLAAWDARVEAIRDFARQRPAIALQQVANYFSTGATARVQVEAGGGSGRVLANHVALAAGATNVFAAGIPLQLTALPDIGQAFMRWEVVTNEATTLIATGSVWRYLDTVTNEVPGWNTEGFDDSLWPEGPGQLGYGDGDERTLIGFGPLASNRYITTYFRGALVVSDPAAFQRLELGLLRDDGAVAYINGREILRDNMPTGTIAIGTLAAAAVAVPAESAYVTFSLSPTNLAAGTNLIAVEVHQVAANSSDVSFDLRLVGARLVLAALTNGPAMDWIPHDGEVVRALFAPAGVSLLPSALSGDMLLAAEGSPYYATGDIFVPSNTTLAAGPGVDILMPDAAGIRVQGRLRLLGTTNNPVRVMPNSNANARAKFCTDPALADAAELKPRWGGISFEHATHTGELVNVVLRGATLTRTDPVNHRAAVSALGSDLYMDGLDVDDVRQPIFVQEGRSTILINSRLHIAFVGDVINVKRSEYARVENCDLSGSTTIDTDAIDYDGIQDGIIRGNRLHDFLGANNDAVDIGEGAESILIESNLIYRMADKGVSIGQASTAILRRNVIRDCALGVGIKDNGSHGLIEYNTFHKTGNAVAIYEKNRGDGGGSAEIRGSIFSESALDPVSVDALSTAQVSYCLSDTLPVPGAGNVNAQPQFLNAAAMNFSLQTGSAAVDAGPQGDPSDPDGSRADMGAIPFDWREGHAVISEIHYHPAESNQAEFVELHNPGGAALDLAGFRFTKGLVFEFPPGTTLEPGGYLVVVAPTQGPGGPTNVLLWTSGVLDNAGETIELHDAASNEVDRVPYAAFDPWPAEANGAGPSLSLINPRRDNAQPENWFASGAAGGTPGAPFDHHLPGPLAYGRSAGGGMAVDFLGLTGLLYVLEFVESLDDPTWQPVDEGYRGLDGRVLLEHAPESGMGTGYYRIRVESP
jgi:hypothetical protein